MYLYNVIYFLKYNKIISKSTSPLHADPNINNFDKLFITL